MLEDSLPTNFANLLANPPKGVAVSERLLEPAIYISRRNGIIKAQLAGIRIIQGAQFVIPAPSNSHTWVIDNGVIRPLPKDAGSLFAELLNNIDPDDMSFSEAIRLLRESDGNMVAVAESDFYLSGKADADKLDTDIQIAGLQANLFPYQARGIKWMTNTINHTRGLILADEMGLGKTLQIIGLLLINPPSDSAPALIVCPTSLMANWEREISKFAPSLSVLLHRGPDRAGIYKDLQTASVVIATYDTVVNDISIFSAFEWSWLICDEAQAIKNPDSNRRRKLSGIPRRNCIPMTGTPVENSLLDLWSLTDFAVPGLLGTRSEFELKFPDTVDTAKALSPYADPIILKRKLADVAQDLPERLDIDIPLELDEHLALHYIKVRNETLAKYPVAGALVATLQLQLICAHPWLRSDSDVGLNTDETPLIKAPSCSLFTPKIERTREILTEAFASGRKVLVFSLFNRIGDLICRSCDDIDGIFWGAINGSTPQGERQAIVDNFSSYDGPACLILNPKAAGAGLNITAATVIIHFTPVWNPALESQASARAHRRGQSLPVTVYRLYYKDTVEEVMIDRSSWKSELANESIPVSTRDESDLKRALEIVPKTI